MRENQCDGCYREFDPDELHNLLWPLCEEDEQLMRALGIELAQGFCPECLEFLERCADAIDPDWSLRIREKMQKEMQYA